MKAKAKMVLSFIGLFILAWIFCAIWPQKNMATPSFWLTKAGEKPKVIAHQGGAQEKPSASNLAFENAAQIGVDFFELDVSITKDNVLAVMHDLTVDRTTDGSGKIKDKTYAELRFLDAGYGLLDDNRDVIRDSSKNQYIGAGAYIPSLEELFINYPGMPMTIEVKNSGQDAVRAATELVRLIEKYDRQNITMVASFNDDSIPIFDNTEHKKIYRSATLNEAKKFLIFHLLGLNIFNNNINYNAFDIPTSFNVAGIKLDLTSTSLRKDMAKRGIAIHYWTVNDPEEMQKLINLSKRGDMPNELSGMDGIMTDSPSKLLEVIANNF